MFQLSPLSSWWRTEAQDRRPRPMKHDLKNSSSSLTVWNWKGLRRSYTTQTPSWHYLELQLWELSTASSAVIVGWLCCVSHHRASHEHPAISSLLLLAIWQPLLLKHHAVVVIHCSVNSSDSLQEEEGRKTTGHPPQPHQSLPDFLLPSREQRPGPSSMALLHGEKHCSAITTTAPRMAFLVWSQHFRVLSKKARICCSKLFSSLFQLSPKFVTASLQ